MEPLALKYRPRRFADLVGQKPTRAVLAKMITSGELPASLIFAGVRGTGKTSVARIVAKAINCHERSGPEPCMKCSSCMAIDGESSPHYLELDAASHGSADRMRELVEDAMYSAGEGWKIYVLDEVHSVSRTGFDVLLKTLEEPPPRTTFILVTTEPERIPDTIQARSMLFRFSKITKSEIVERLLDVVAGEQLMIEETAAGWIADQANGGMRDALMMLDQVSRLEAPIIRVGLLTGLFGEQSVGAWIEALVSGNPAKAVITADELVAAHGSVGALIDRALITLRDALLSKSGYGEMPADLEQVRLSSTQIIEMVRKLWSMRNQVRTLGPDDRAAVVALSAEMSRGPVAEVYDRASDVEILEVIGSG